MEITSEAVASPVKAAEAGAEIAVAAVAGSDDSDFAPPRLTKRPSRRGEQ